jgi:hypothetical protein
MIRAIIKDIVITSSANHQSGMRCVTLTLQNRELGGFRASGTPRHELNMEPGDLIEIEPLPDFEGVYFGENIKIVEKQIIRPIELIATVSHVRARKLRNSWGRSWEWLALTISADGFTSTAGSVPLAPGSVRIERGMRCAFTGFPAVRPDGKPSLEFVYGGVTILAREAHDPIALAARRVFPGFTDAHLRTLRIEFRDDWAQCVCVDQGVLDRPAFGRWRATTKRGVAVAAKELSAMPPMRSDLLTVGVTNKTISRLIEGLGTNDETRPNKGGDAFTLVRSRHLSFAQADDANRLGNFFRPTFNRALGAIWEGLREAEDRGDSAILLTNARDYLMTQYGFVDAAIDEALQSLGEQYSNVETIGGYAKAIAFRENAHCERAILKTVGDMRRNSVAHTLAPIDGRFDDAQQRAIRMALQNSVSAITGGPGTGKTSICREIGAQFESVLGVAVAARAARNLGERAGIEAMTVARFLHFAWKEQIASYDALIIDEASMVGSKDMLKILDSARAAGIERLIMVGDSDQLPPVNWGAPFADLIAAKALPVATLMKIYRTKEGGGIARLSADVRDGKALALARGYDDISFIDARGDTDMSRAAVREYMRLLESGARFEDIGLLTPYSDPKFPIGAVALNAVIRKALGKPVDCATVGDIVIGTRNQYKGRYVLNGSRGIVIDVGGPSSSGQALTIQFECDDEPAVYAKDELGREALPDGVAWGYASSIHKAQGGEFKHVIAIVARRMARMFGKPALYTAFSRAKQTLAVVGEIDAVPKIAGELGQKRTTALAAMLTKPEPKTRPAVGGIDLDARLAAFKEQLDLLPDDAKDEPVDRVG